MSGIISKFKRVMIIDDNPIDIYIACKLIANRNFAEKTLSFPNAILALDFLERHRDNPVELPEIIIVDIYMPLMSGFEFLDAFEKFPPDLKQRCNVYVVSSSIDESDIQRVKENKNVKGFGTKTICTDFLDSIESPFS